MDEKQLINRCRKGNRKAQRIMVEQYSQVLYQVCCRYVIDKNFAKDCLQESWVQIFWNLDKYEDKGLWKAWITRVTINKCKELLRKNKRWKIDEMQDSHPVNDLNMESKIVQEESITEILDKLPIRYRMVVNMYLIEEYSHKEIAAVMEISESSSRSILSRALTMLRKDISAETKKQYLSKKKINNGIAI